MARKKRRDDETNPGDEVPKDIAADAETSEIPPNVVATGSTNELPGRDRIVEAEVGGEGVADVVFEREEDEEDEGPAREAA